MRPRLGENRSFLLLVFRKAVLKGDRENSGLEQYTRRQQISKSQATLTSARESLEWGKGSQKAMEKFISIVGLRRKSFFNPFNQSKLRAGQMLQESWRKWRDERSLYCFLYGTQKAARPQKGNSCLVYVKQPHRDSFSPARPDSSRIIEGTEAGQKSS